MIMVKEKQRGYGVTFLVGNVEYLKCLDNGKRNRKYGIKPGIKDQNIKKNQNPKTHEKSSLFSGQIEAGIHLAKTIFRSFFLRVVFLVK